MESVDFNVSLSNLHAIFAKVLELRDLLFSKE